CLFRGLFSCEFFGGFARGCFCAGLFLCSAFLLSHHFCTVFFLYFIDRLLRLNGGHVLSCHDHCALIVIFFWRQLICAIAAKQICQFFFLRHHVRRCWSLYGYHCGRLGGDRCRNWSGF